MSLKAVQNVGEKYAKRYGWVAVLSIAVAAVVTVVIGAVSDPSRVVVLPRLFDLPLSVTVFLQTVLVCFVGGLLVRLVYEHSDTLTSVYHERVDPLIKRWYGIARRTRAVIVGVVTAVVAGGLTAAAGFVVAVPSAAITTAGLIAWPVGTYWTLARAPTAGSSGSGTLWGRYAELRLTETRTIALLIGYVFAAVTGGSLWWVGVDTAMMVGVAGLVWLVATVIVYNRYERALTERTDLSIVAVDVTDEGLELRVENRGHETVALTEPTIADTTLDRYRLAECLGLQPGETVSLKLPSTFRLAPTDNERTLPLGYTLDRSQPAPTIYSRTGSAFALQLEGSVDDSMESPDSIEYATATAAPQGAHSQD